MSETPDLRALLRSWPYDPDEDVRFVQGDDGREILQVRTPLGLEQHELDGRPDGLRPHGLESEFDFQLRQLDRARAAGALAQFELAPDDCARLFAEGTLYYYRYLRLFQLRDWPRAIRDTGRNLRVFDFIHEHARRAEDRNNLEKWRPYVLRMNGAAQALLRVEKGEPAAALAVLTRTQRKIEQLEELHDETFDFERERSLLALRELADQIQQSQPPSELDRLQSQLERAIADQEFERAARLRDRIRALNQTGRSPA